MSDINDSPTTKTRLGKLLNWRPKSILSRILISLLIVLPIAGSAVYMWSMWDPTVYLKHVPIAIVNDDAGVGEDNFGQDVVKGLKEEPYLNISQVDAKEARSGLLEDRYLFTISIPKDFSQKINTVIDPKPQQARINITYNDYNGSAGAFLTGGLVPSSPNPSPPPSVKTTQNKSSWASTASATASSKRATARNSSMTVPPKSRMGPTS